MTDKEAIQQFLDALVAEVKQRVPKVSGETADSLEVIVDDFGGKIMAAPYIQTLEDGRPPTRSGAPKGDPTLQQKIYAWILQMGLGTNAKSQERLSWAMATKIHNEGNRLWRSGGHSGVLSNVFTKERIDSFANTFFGRYETQISSDVMKQYIKPA